MGHVPPEMVWAVSTFLDFTYLVRRQVISANVLQWVKKTVENFHEYRKIFKAVGIVDDFNLPRQHVIVHYPRFIQQFGAPNGLCTSITESKHKHVKTAYKHTNRVAPVEQMTKYSERMDKMSAQYTEYQRRGMLPREKVGKRSRRNKRKRSETPFHKDDLGTSGVADPVSDEDDDADDDAQYCDGGEASSCSDLDHSSGENDSVDRIDAHSDIDCSGENDSDENNSDDSIDAHTDDVGVDWRAVLDRRKTQRNTRLVSSACTGQRHCYSATHTSSSSSSRSKRGDHTSTSTLSRTPGMY